METTKQIDSIFNAGVISVIKRLTLRWLKDNNTHISMGFSATYLIYEREDKKDKFILYRKEDDKDTRLGCFELLKYAISCANGKATLI